MPHGSLGWACDDSPREQALLGNLLKKSIHLHILPQNLSPKSPRPGLKSRFRGQECILLLQRTLVQTPAPTWWLPTLCNSSSRGLAASGLQRFQNTCGAHKLTRPYIPTHGIRWICSKAPCTSPLFTPLCPQLWLTPYSPRWSGPAMTSQTSEFSRFVVSAAGLEESHWRAPE